MSCLFAALLLVAPGRAAAHGIDTETADVSDNDFVSVDIEHMLLGWDHLLFVAGVLLIAAEVKLECGPEHVGGLPVII